MPEMGPVVVRGVLTLAVTLVLAACGTTTNDEAASSSSTTTPPTPTIPVMTPVPTPPPGQPLPFRDYLSSIGVTAAPTHFDQAPGLVVTVPVPDGWARTGDPLFATGVDFVQPVGGDGTYPSSTLMAIALDGNFDPKDAIRHANTDALPPNSTDVTESFDDYQGFPSAGTQGNAAGAQHYSRIVLATVPSTGKRYLVQLNAMTRVDQPIAQSAALSAIIAGFTVTVT